MYSKLGNLEQAEGNYSECVTGTKQKHGDYHNLTLIAMVYTTMTTITINNNIIIIIIIRIILQRYTVGKKGGVMLIRCISLF